MSKCKLIITADDYGITEGVNKGIIEAYKNGIVTRASIIANGEAFDQAVLLAKENNGLKVGVHLTLIEENPINPPDRIESLVNQNGKFLINYQHVIIKYLFCKIKTNEVYIEWESQIRKVLNAGIVINHLDSHQHLHMLPRMFDITLDLARKYNINKIRIIKCELRRIRHFKEVVMMMLELFNRKKIMDSDLNIPDYFYGLKESGNLSEPSLLNLIENLKSGVTEIMCHPGHMDSVLRSKYRHWSATMHYDNELKALLSERVAEMLRRKKIDLFY